LEEMRKKWLSDLSGLSEKWLEEFQAGIGRYVDGMMRDALNPEAFVDFMRRSGVDFNGFASALKSQPAFDPYRILGLDRSATDEDVKKRHREFMFQLVMTAYEAIKRERGWT
jgi:hypothetical protein